MNNLNNYYDYLNNYNDMNFITNPNTLINDMNFITNPNTLINDMNYQTTFPNTFIMPANNDISNSQIGFKRGNMFNNTYSEYSNYKPQELKAISERDDLLMQIDEQRFALIDLGLYLDIYPNNKNVLNEFNNYLKKEKELITIYESKYGPMSITSPVQTNNWLWNNSPWPWEVQN